MISNTLKAKELLNKLLKENLDNRLSNLENNTQNEITTLSKIELYTKKMINYLSSLSYTTKDFQEKKQIIIPKFQSENNNRNNFDEAQNNKKREVFVEINGVFKNKKNIYLRKKRQSIISIYSDNNKENINPNNNIKFKSNYVNKSPINKIIINKTPEPVRRFKPILSNYPNKKEKIIKKKFSKENNSLNNQKKKKNYKLKSAKNLTEINEKNNKYKKYINSLILDSKNKKINNDNSNEKNLYNSNRNNYNNNNNNEYKIKLTRRGKKSSIELFTKKSKNATFSPINQFNLNDTKKYNSIENEILNEEKNLKSLCESLLIDVNDDELLVNSSILNDNIGTESKKLSSKNLDEIIENKRFSAFKSCIKFLIEFLNIQDIFNLIKTKKEILKIVLNLQIKIIRKSIDGINSFLKTKGIDTHNDDISLLKINKPFEFNNNSIKAITLFNSISKTNFIKSIKCYNNQNNLNMNNNLRKIILIFDLYFIALGDKKYIYKFSENYNLKIEYICNYFKNNKNKSIGAIIENDLKGKKFDDIIINNLYDYSYKYIEIINPNYYKKINKDIAILVFLIKNILDYVGISYFEINNKTNNKINVKKLFLLGQSRLNIKNIILDKYNKLLNNLN